MLEICFDKTNLLVTATAVAVRRLPDYNNTNAINEWLILIILMLDALLAVAKIVVLNVECQGFRAVSNSLDDKSPCFP